ncbi:MAG: flagellar biosynthetic protein FliR [Chthoniobacterales bacterium]|nr:flagellar biosynthetic protein FliR [Chthoniobacterales bacterium]
MIPLDFSWLFPNFLVFTRITGFFSILPVFSAQLIPRPLRVAIAFLIAISISDIVLNGYIIPNEWLQSAYQIFHEFVTGFMMGLMVRIVLYALEVAGEFISISIGLSLSSQIDPFTRDRATPPNIMLVSLATVLFLTTNSHLWCLAGFIRSYEIFSPTSVYTIGSLEQVLILTKNLFLIAIQICAPLMAISFVVNLCFATLGRAAPSLNVFLLSFPVQILVGMFILALLFIVIANQIANQYYLAPENMLSILR